MSAGIFVYSLSLAEAKEKLLDACAKITSGNNDLAVLQNQLGFSEGKLTVIKMSHTAIELHLRLLIAAYVGIVLEPNTKSAVAE